MTGWGPSFLGSLANVALILTSIKVLSDLLAAWLGEHHQQRFRSFFERWQASLLDASPDALLNAPLSALASTYERVLGPKPFSRQAFRRTCIFGSLFLGASLGFAGLLCGKPFAMNLPPWKSFLTSLDYLRVVAAQPSIRQQAGDPFYFAQNSSDLASLASWPFTLGFTVYFAVVVVFSTAVLFSVSVAASRLFLREMISARTAFRVFVLFVSSSLLLSGLGAAASLILFVLLNVWTWPFLPFFFAISNVSLILSAGVASAASLSFWFFSAPWLRVVVTLALFPSILLAIVTGVALLAFPFRRRFHGAAACVLRLSLRSPKGVFPFLSASSAALAWVLVALAAFSAWLARLSLSVGVPTFFGVDSLIFSCALLAVLLVLSLARASSYHLAGSPAERTQAVFFLFFGTLCVITFGYYFQAILECFVNVQSAGAIGRAGSLALPAVSAIIPGLVAGYIVVFSRAAGTSWIKTAVRIFTVLATFDLFAGVRGLVSYHDFFLSVLFDLLGSPICAFVVFKAHALLFRPGSSEVAPH
jgi:hypothetical protein